MVRRALEKGERLGEYILLGRIGGAVWKARHADAEERIVAVRFLEAPQEIEAIRKGGVDPERLTHPNLVRTIGMDLDADPPYLVLEYVQGRTLRTVLEEDGLLPPPYAIDIAVQILDALHHLHESGFWHGAVRPENVIVDKKAVELKDRRRAICYWIKLAAPGIGSVERCRESLLRAESLTPAPGTAPGFCYLAPEQLDPGIRPDRRADLYTTGVVLYEMLTGVPPLGVDLPSELNPVVPEELDRIVKRALAVDRDRRYATAVQMRKDLQEAKRDIVRRIEEARPRVEKEAGAPAAADFPGGVPRPLKRRPGPLPLLQRLGKIGTGTLAVAVAVGISLIALFGLAHFGSPADRKVSEPAITEAAIHVSTEPLGAEVFLDGRRVGATPLEIAPLAFEPHEVRLRRRFYADRVLLLLPKAVGKSRWFRVRELGGETDLFEVGFSRGARLENLMLERQRGDLHVETPGVGGVRVLLNGEVRGVTPLDLRGLDAGVYGIRLEKDGFRPVELSVTVVGESVITLPIMMPEAGSEEVARSTPEVSELEIVTEPAGAEVTIDGRVWGKTPLKARLRPGAHTIRVEKKYFVPREVEMTFRDSAEVRLRFPLARVRGPLTVTSTPEGAEVEIGGKLYGTTPLRVAGMEAGRYRLRLKKEGYEPVQKEIEIAGALGAVEAFELKEIDPSAIRFRCAVEGLWVYVDGRRVGKTGKGPGRVRVRPGKHTMVVAGWPFEVKVPHSGEARVEVSAEDVGLVRVEGGKFVAGTEVPRGTTGLPRRTVTLAGFWIERNEVTNARYRRFVEYIRATGDHSTCHPDEPKGKDHAPARRYWEDGRYNQPDQPVVGIDFYDAWAYAAWTGMRLPSELEWERAARGTTGQEYPWGNTWDPTRGNWGDAGRPAEERDGFEYTAPVGSYHVLGMSPAGCYDMAGNVAEWTRDFLDRDGELVVVRGGSWLSGQEQLKTWFRDTARARSRGQAVGFRCVLPGGE